ncbi:unnamed protein product [Didymodactylos carnosus]|uniref:Pentatricopeptide repeat-containing protein n=1 Tax=Didymodactylos carnosus TaxID=1234261 RepID=A0A8S2EMT4_9BILA|nr:unnamed protein product [Didymodactylos carnosus]CAF4000397.1 unnamed protein product [Didymodactylos carnosus]
MKGYNANELPEKTIEKYEQMVKNQIQPNNVTYLLIFKAYGECVRLGKEKSVHIDVTKNNNIDENNLVIQTALIDMYDKMGDVKRAEEIFTRILNRRNVVSFGAMMKCYNVNELPERTIELYEEMIRKEIEPDNERYLYNTV